MSALDEYQDQWQRRVTNNSLRYLYIHKRNTPHNNSALFANIFSLHATFRFHWHIPHTLLSLLFTLLFCWDFYSTMCRSISTANAI